MQSLAGALLCLGRRCETNYISHPIEAVTGYRNIPQSAGFPESHLMHPKLFFFSFLTLVLIYNLLQGLISIPMDG